MCLVCLDQQHIWLLRHANDNITAFILGEFVSYFVVYSLCMVLSHFSLMNMQYLNNFFVVYWSFFKGCSASLNVLSFQSELIFISLSSKFLKPLLFIRLCKYDIHMWLWLYHIRIYFWIWPFCLGHGGLHPHLPCLWSWNQPNLRL